MKRINIIGTTGSGKSTFAVALSKRLGYPCVQMDQLFWKPNWAESSDEEFFPKLTKAISGELWVLDGNYSRTNDIKWKRADTIIWLDLGYTHTLLQLLKRTLTRSLSRKELWPGTGNKESLYRSFLTKDSILLWFFRCYPKSRLRYSKLMQSTDHSDIQMIRLRSRSEIRHFLKNAQNKSLLPTHHSQARLVGRT